MVLTVNKPESNAKIPGMPEEEACAWRICWCVKFRTKGCTRTSMLAHTVLSPCTKNANENEKWVLKNIIKKQFYFAAMTYIYLQVYHIQFIWKC